MTPAIDIYAFGMCALEMASLEIQGDNGMVATQEWLINRTIESLDDPLQKNLIYQCLTADYEKRPSARTLLFHPVLFEVHALKLLSAHALVKTGKCVVPIRKQPRFDRPHECNLMIMLFCTFQTPRKNILPTDCPMKCTLRKEWWPK